MLCNFIGISNLKGIFRQAVSVWYNPLQMKDLWSGTALAHSFGNPRMLLERYRLIVETVFRRGVARRLSRVTNMGPIEERSSLLRLPPLAKFFENQSTKS